MGSRLRKLKALWEKKLSDGKTIGGKGRLTDAIISKLTFFYGNAIRANSHNVNEMRQAVWAVWAHTSSTDDELKHWFCPKVKNSWFWFGNSSKTIIKQGVDSSNGPKRDCRCPDFHKRILFSDEAHFWLNGYVNKQNCRIWSEANPQVYVETPLHPEKLTVWCALWAGGIILQKMKATTLQSMVIGIEP
ncbi:uncharacterized protein TNCV_4979321 [Trichonephila clavipes]|nr:uncharacterized protein TNCV_4979321 [Trichonephila clavipes]